MIPDKIGTVWILVLYHSVTSRTQYKGTYMFGVTSGSAYYQYIWQFHAKAPTLQWCVHHMYMHVYHSHIACQDQGKNSLNEYNFFICWTFLFSTMVWKQLLLYEVDNCLQERTCYNNSEIIKSSYPWVLFSLVLDILTLT